MTSEERLKRLERTLSELYKASQDEIAEKWNKYLERQKERSEKALQRIRDAKTDEDKKSATEKYVSLMKSLTSGNKHYRDMVRAVAKQITDVNSRALEIVNSQRTGFYADGYNLSAEEINHFAIDSNVGIRFDLCSAEAVEWMAERIGDLNLPPPREVRSREDMTWNMKNINSQMAQGIIQGESIPKIAKRLMNVSDMNEKAAIRNARTMATGCQNGGRVDAMKRAEEWGVKTKKEWVCTHDDRTRDSHLDIDGEQVNPEEWFSNGCRYPGDPVGPAEEVWNCRCTLITVVDGFSSNLPKGKEAAVHVWFDGEKVK